MPKSSDMDKMPESSDMDKMPQSSDMDKMPESSDMNKLIQIILILSLPPLAVWYHDRACSCQVCLNIFLLFLLVFPATIHAMWYCFMRK